MRGQSLRFDTKIASHSFRKSGVGVSTIILSILLSLLGVSQKCLGQQSVSKVETKVAQTEKAKEQVDPLLTKPTPKVVLATTQSENQLLLKKIDQIVRTYLYDKKLVTEAWEPALEKEKPKILASRTLPELFQSVNKALSSLQSSHCEFATCNEEIFYFLRGLFGSFNNDLEVRVPIDYTGLMTGPPRFAENQVRYIVNGSPAAKSGLQVGDEIASVDGEKYLGQYNFAGKSGKIVPLIIKRNGERITLHITPVKADEYQRYVKATKESGRKFQEGGHNLAYIHNWCGGRDGHEAFEEALSKLDGTEGLVLDLRDGYGGNSLSDLDYFNRNPAGYPIFKTTSRDGKISSDVMFYDKHVVAIINDGARSGKELLAFSLKKSGRATLIGQRTAGYVLAGRFFKLTDRAILYLAVLDCTIGGERLEGIGVSSDIEVEDHCSQAGKDEQMRKATEKLIQIIESQK